MTTIAYRDGVMAADSLMTHYNHREGDVRKIAASLHNGAIAGVSGRADRCDAFLDWFAEKWEWERDVPQHLQSKSVDGLVACRDGVLLAWDGGSRLMELSAPFAAIGSGSRFALGAMATGADAAAAVAIAIQFDIYSGGRITTLSLASPPERQIP